MKYRQLGASDLKVSEISLGSWLTYGVGVARDRAAACVDRAFGLGINFIDTANVYGRGAAESFLGEILATRPRPGRSFCRRRWGNHRSAHRRRSSRGMRPGMTWGSATRG